MAKNIRKQLIEIGVLLTILAVLYLTGWQAEVAGFMQRGIMLTGLHNVDVNKPIENKPVNLNFKVKDLNGKELDVYNLKGKTLFVNFWATWCPPCIAEMPSIESLWQQKKGEVAFLIISTEDDTEKIQKFVDRKDLTLPVYQLASSLPNTFKANAIPATFVISPEGNLVYKHEGIANYNTSNFKEFLSAISKGI